MVSTNCSCFGCTAKWMMYLIVFDCNWISMYIYIYTYNYICDVLKRVGCIWSPSSGPPFVQPVFCPRKHGSTLHVGTWICLEALCGWSSLPVGRRWAMRKGWSGVRRVADRCGWSSLWTKGRVCCCLLLFSLFKRDHVFGTMVCASIFQV